MTTEIDTIVSKRLLEAHGPPKFVFGHPNPNASGGWAQHSSGGMTFAPKGFEHSEGHTPMSREDAQKHLASTLQKVTKIGDAGQRLDHSAAASQAMKHAETRNGVFHIHDQGASGNGASYMPRSYGGYKLNTTQHLGDGSTHEGSMFYRSRFMPGGGSSMGHHWAGSK